MLQIILIVVLLLVGIYTLTKKKSKCKIYWFFSTGCGHCTRMQPAWNEFVQMCPETIEVQKINTAENQQMAQEYGVNGVPYIVKVTDDVRHVYNGSRTAQDLYDFATTTL